MMSLWVWYYPRPAPITFPKILLNPLSPNMYVVMLHISNFLPRPLTTLIFGWPLSPGKVTSFLDSSLYLIFTLTDSGVHLVHLNGVCRFPFWIPWWIIGGAIFNQTMWKSSCHKLCTWMVSLLHGSSDGTSSLLILKISCHTLCNWMASLECDSLHDSSPGVEKLLSYLVHFNGCFLHGSSYHLFKSLDHEKLLPQFMHLNGFSPLWFLSWIVMWKSSWYFHGFFPSFLPSYVERLRIA